VELLLPTQSPSLGFSLNETFSLFQSSHYSLQLTSLSLIYFYLQNDLDHLKNLKNLSSSKITSSSASLVPVVNAVKATKKLTKLRSQKGKPSNSSSPNSCAYSPQAVIEICQNGYLRQLCWCLLHSEFVIRALTLKVPPTHAPSTSSPSIDFQTLP
jgi:hypothetical protein